MPARPLALHACGQGLVNVPQDIIYMFNADRHAHHVGHDAGLDLLFGFELAVRGGCGVDDQGAGIADIGQVAHELRRFDKAHTGFQATLNAKGQEARSAGQSIDAAHLALYQIVLRMVRQAGVIDPADARIIF